MNDPSPANRSSRSDGENLARGLTLLLGASLVLAGCATVSPQAENRSGLTFVHLNDTYRVGAVEDGSAGGFGRTVTVVRNLQAQGRDVRILHGGDFLYPSLESQLWDGRQMIDAFNFLDAVAPMYVVAGNHEFDRRSAEPLIAAMRGSDFDWLGDNYELVSEDDQAPEFLPEFTFMHGDRKIGIFALTLHADDGGNARDYVPIDRDYRAAAERVIAEFERQGVDAIIGLTHLNLWDDIELARLRKDHPKFVLIAGGHEHEPEYSPISDGSAAVVKGASNARVIWTIELDFDAGGMPIVDPRRLELDESVSVDAGYRELENRWRARVLEKYPFLEAKIGVAALPLDARESTIRSRESGWGNFIADQMREPFGTRSDFAFINSGSLRIDDWVADEISFEDVSRTFGFSSYLRQVTLTGAELKEVMEAGYRGSGTGKGYFPQVSGFRICIDRERPSGDRVVSLQVETGEGWREIEDSREYSVIVPDYLFNDGDGYSIPKHRPASPPGSELKYLVLDAIVEAHADDEKVGAPITPQSRRFHELEESAERCFE